MAGETTAVAATAARRFRTNPGAGLFAVQFDLTFSDTQNQLADVMEAGYIGEGVRVLAVQWLPSDMDTNVSPLVTHKVTVGSTDIVTGLTGAQTGTGQLVPATTLATTTARTKVKVTTSAAAATAAAGTAKLILWCQRA